LGGAQRAHLFSLKGVDDRIEGTEGDYWYSSLRQGLQDIRGAMHGREEVGLCGPDVVLGRINWENLQVPRLTDYRDRNLNRGDFVYVMPRGVFCDSGRIEQLQRTRTVIKRVERGGGLIYMVLGPPA